MLSSATQEASPQSNQYHSPMLQILDHNNTLPNTNTKISNTNNRFSSTHSKPITYRMQSPNDVSPKSNNTKNLPKSNSQNSSHHSPPAPSTTNIIPSSTPPPNISHNILPTLSLSSNTQDDPQQLHSLSHTFDLAQKAIHTTTHLPAHSSLTTSSTTNNGTKHNHIYYPNTPCNDQPNLLVRGGSTKSCSRLYNGGEQPRSHNTHQQLEGPCTNHHGWD